MLAEMQQDIELDRGTTSVARDSERTCALTRQPMPAEQMIRFVISPTGEVVADVKRKLPGRGLWITGTCGAVDEAVKRNVFSRGFKREVKARRDLSASVDQALERTALEALAIAGKAGLVIAGAAKVEAALGRDDLKALIHAADASAEGTRKLEAALRRNKEEKAAEITVVGIFSGSQLDLALNRPNVVHAALLAGPGVETFLARVRRLQRFRTGN